MPEEQSDEDVVRITSNLVQFDAVVTDKRTLLPPSHDAPAVYGTDCDRPFVTSVAVPLLKVPLWSSG